MQRFAAVAKLSGKSDLEIGKLLSARKSGNSMIPHRIHVASKDDGVVDLANLAEWLHGGPL